MKLSAILPRFRQLALLYDMRISNAKHFKFLDKYIKLEKKLNIN